MANLPYSVASPLLVELAEADEPPERMVATLQLEVARRIDAATGSEHYGVLGLLLRLALRVAWMVQNPRLLLFPGAGRGFGVHRVGAPARSRCCPEHWQRSFTKIVKRGFSQRRKMMFKLLKQDLAEENVAHAVLQRLASRRKSRAEELSLEQFARLTEFLSK